MTARRQVVKRKSSSGQAPILAGLLFLLLVPTTIILAENATESNVTGLVIDNLPIPLNETLPTSTVSITNSTPVTGELETNVTSKSGEGEINVYEILNSSLVTVIATENSSNLSENMSDEPLEPPLEAQGKGPDLRIKLDIPEKADRSSEFIANAEVSNIGETTAREVEISWILPRGIEIIEGSSKKTCDIDPKAACNSAVILSASFNSLLGKREISVEVRYVD